MAFWLHPFAPWPSAMSLHAVAWVAFGCIQKVSVFVVFMTFIFRLFELVRQLVRSAFSHWFSLSTVFMGAAMEQKELPLVGRLDGPSTAPPRVIALAKTYREAVRLAWQIRRIKKSTFRQLAAETEMPPQHASDYMNPDDKPTRRSLPAERIAAFEAFVGNTVVSQWLASQSKLTVLEEMQAERMTA